VSPSWDLFIILFFAVCVGYGLLLGKSRVSGILLSSYVGLAVASETGDILVNSVRNLASFSEKLAATSSFTLKTLIFAFIIVFLTLKNENVQTSSSDRGMISTLFSGAYGFLSGGLILTSIGMFMTDVEKASIYNQSSLAQRIMDLRFWWLLLPILAIIVAGFIRDRKSVK